MSEIATFGTAAPQTKGEATSPFIGPRPFARSDAIYFFGRDHETRLLGSMVAASTLTVLYGGSGAGKTSLLNAKLPEQLESIEPDWIVVHFSAWQDRFFEALCATVNRAIEERMITTPALLTRPDSFSRDLIFIAREEDYPILLVFDQFEEYFLYHPTGRADFELHLSYLGNLRNSDVHILLSLRSDRFFLLDRLRQTIPEIYRNLFRVKPLDETGAADAIINPVHVYNIRHSLHLADEITVEQELLSALINGSDEEIIRLRLPLLGRGTSETARPDVLQKTNAQRIRVVAPFLQLALQAVWREDVEVGRRNILRVATLRQMTAGDGPVDPSSAEPGQDGTTRTPDKMLVGLLVQQHLDRILDRPPEVQEIAARLFDRMVTSSGGKVAISLPDDLHSVLTTDQIAIAEKLLIELSSAGENALVRHGGVDEHTRGRNRFEILHDALAAPLLDWIARWRRKQAVDQERQAAAQRLQEERDAAEQRLRLEQTKAELARQEAAAKYRKLIGYILGAFAFALIVGAVLLGEHNYEERWQFSELAIAEANAPTPDFRKRLLVLLASEQSWERGIWHILPAPLSLKKKIHASLERSVLRSPTAGGDFDAVGTSHDGLRFAVVDIRAGTVAVFDVETGKSIWSQALPGGLRSLLGSDRLTERPPDIKVSKIQVASSGGTVPPAVGFVDGLATPVIYYRGIIYYTPSAEPNADSWLTEDIADHLKDNLTETQAFPWVEISGGTILVQFSQRLGTQARIARLGYKSGSPSGFELASLSPPVRNPGFGFNPVLSARMSGLPDRYAYLRLENATPLPGQLRKLQAIVGDLADMSGNPKALDIGEPTNANAMLTEATRIGAGPLLPSVAFSDEGYGLVVRDGRSWFTFVIDGSGMLQPGRHLQLRPIEDGTAIEAGGDFGTRPIAAVQIENKWRIAWLQRNGVTVADEAEAGGTLIARTDGPLLSGLDGGYRLSFSSNGRFLMLKRQSFGGKPSLRIWDLDVGRTGIERPTVSGRPADLSALACREAKVDPRGSALSNTERPALFQDAIPQPCGD
jgi:hypothetical protein